jgi:hypothetical protein
MICVESGDRHFAVRSFSFETHGSNWRSRSARIERTCLIQYYRIRPWPALAIARCPDVNNTGSSSVADERIGICAPSWLPTQGLLCQGDTGSKRAMTAILLSNQFHDGFHKAWHLQHRGAKPSISCIARDAAPTRPPTALPLLSQHPSSASVYYCRHSFSL